MHKSLARAVLGALVAATWSVAAVAAPAKRVILPDDVVPSAYRLSITPHAAQSTFDGSVEIDVDVRRRTDRIVLDAAELQIDSAQLSGEARAPRVALDAAGERATFAFGHPLALGRHTLEIAYRGKIFDQASGLFKLVHATPAGPVTSLFTQFEDSDARRFVPSWDEPARRATFDLTVTVPADQTAVGNMPVAATEALDSGRKRVRFATTPRMSTYLLFFGLGDFERVQRSVAGVDVGVVVKRGDTASAAYALDAAAAILPFYNQWFGTPYPLPKLDMVAGAGESASFGAMENWGAIFYFERDLLIDPARASEDDRRRVFETVAHEVAHQWFGNLVTMAWWDDLWLNEGFATWMATKAEEQLHPEWNAWPRTASYKQRAMDIDARRGTHPVITRFDDVKQVEGAFDTITYGKGSQVVRTLEAYVGPEEFRVGVRHYLAQHAYGNSVTDDLWRALEAASPRPVRTIARDLTAQPGVPLITELDATCAAGRTTVTLSQGQFALDDSGRARTWHTPVALAILGGGGAHAVITGPTPQRIGVDGCGPLLINAGQKGYLRSRYSAAGLAALTAHFAQLSVDDQLGLLIDTGALAGGGQVPMGDWMALMRQVPADVDPLVAGTLVEQLTDVDRLHDGLPTQPAFRAFARALLAPIFARIGWQPAAGDAGNALSLRADLIVALGTFDDAAVVAEASRRFERALADRASLDGELRLAVLQVVALRADARTWDALHGLARSATAHTEQDELYGLLGTARDPAQHARALALAVSSEAPATVGAGILRSASESRPGATLAFVATHWAQVTPLFDSGAAGTVASRYFSTADDVAMLAPFDAFVAAHVPVPVRGRAVRTASVIRYRAGLRDKRVPQADAWIAAH
jgi:aminopeptidase N